MTKKKRDDKMQFTIQAKLIGIFLLTTAILFFVNIYMYANINHVITKIETIYTSNMNLNELQNALDRVQSSMQSYLSTKSSDSMEEYFRSEQDYQNSIKALNDKVVNDPSLMMEKNIRNMSEDYLKLTNTAIETKRSRNISKYIESYESAEALYKYIEDYLYCLNNRQFQNNSSNYQLLTSSLKSSEVINMVVLVVTGFFNICLIVFMVRSITRPLKDLAFAANEVADENMDIGELHIESNDEIGILTNAFNQMVQSLKSYINRLRESMEMESAFKEKELKTEAHLKEARLKYLQAQVNPHFLFNTLNAGAQLAMLEGSDRTYEYIQNVADFFRYNLKNNNSIVTLKEEIEMVDHYVYILNVRYANEIHYSKEVDNALLEVEIPSMILQPIVENSIKHGISNIDWTGHICLRITDHGSFVQIIVTDNGVGMNREQLEQIRSGNASKENADRDARGIGLDNLISRLNLYLGGCGSFQIESEGKNKGTEVIIQIPKFKEAANV